MSEMKITGMDLAQHVRAYQRRQKNDYNDAQAIAEACQHGTIRPVPTRKNHEHSRK